MNIPGGLLQQRKEPISTLNFLSPPGLRNMPFENTMSNWQNLLEPLTSPVIWGIPSHVLTTCWSLDHTSEKLLQRDDQNWVHRPLIFDGVARFRISYCRSCSNSYVRHNYRHLQKEMVDEQKSCIGSDHCNERNSMEHSLYIPTGKQDFGPPPHSGRFIILRWTKI